MPVRAYTGRRYKDATCYIKAGQGHSLKNDSPLKILESRQRSASVAAQVGAWMAGM